MKSYLEEIDPALAIPSTPMKQGAAFRIRLLARLVDFAFTGLLGLMAGFGIGVIVGVLSSMGRLEGELETLLNQLEVSTVTGIVAAFTYQIMAEGIGGMSLGKLICGLRVVQMDGRSCTFLGAIKRSLLFYVDGLFFGLVAYNSMKDGPLQQRYGDFWAKTVVVKRVDFSATPAIASWKIVVGLLLGSVAWLAIVCADLITDLP